MSNLNIDHTYSLDKNIKSIGLSGNLSAMDAINFKANVLEMISTQSVDFEINLEELDTLDVTGLNALVIAHKKMKQKGLKLTMISKENGQFSELIHLAKFSNYFNMKVA